MAVVTEPPVAIPRAVPRVAPRLAGRAIGRHGTSVQQSVLSALEALNANKIRSLLTMLGIIIGVGAVIVMIALGVGARANVAARLQGLGTNVLTVFPGSFNFGGARAGVGTRPTITEDDAKAIAKLPDVVDVSPVISSSAQVIANNQNWNTRVWGVYPSYMQINNWQIQDGRFFDQADDQAARPMALLGKTVVENLFPDTDPIGQQIRVRNVQFTVIGTLFPKGQQGFFDQDDVVLLPFKTANRRLFNATNVNNISIQAVSAESVASVQKEVEVLLRERHKLTGPQNDFLIRNINDVIQTAQGVATTMSLLLAGVAGVSLLVGGIGIMNIMLVSVTERTREIGIRMAIGARTRDILSQFLIEAVVLSAAGGLIGIGVGLVGSVLLARLAQWNVIVTPSSILLSFGFAALVGVFFGFYPARKASRLDPIEALRYE